MVFVPSFKNLLIPLSRLSYYSLKEYGYVYNTLLIRILGDLGCGFKDVLPARDVRL